MNHLRLALGGRFYLERKLTMLVKELIGRLNSYNMDAEVIFKGGDQLEVELVNNENEIITDGGNAKQVKVRIISAIELPNSSDTTIGAPLVEPES